MTRLNVIHSRQVAASFNCASTPVEFNVLKFFDSFRMLFVEVVRA